MDRLFAVTSWTLQGGAALVHEPLLKLNYLVKRESCKLELILLDVAQDLHNVLSAGAGTRRAGSAWCCSWRRWETLVINAAHDMLHSLE